MNLHKIKIMPLLAASFLMLASATLAGCDDDDTTVVDPVLTFETGDNAVHQNADAVGIASSGYLDRTKALKYTVRSNTHWTVSVTDEDAADWVLIHPSEGDGDGLFFIGIKENTRFDARATTVAVQVDGEDSPRLITINQDGAVASIKTSANVTVNGAGGSSTLSVNANIDWTCEILPGEDNVIPSWIRIDSYNDNAINITTDRRDEDSPRYATIRINCEKSPESSCEIEITQFGPSVVMYEDFEWLAGYATDNTWYDASSPKGMTAWTGAQLGMGWTSWIGESKTINVYGGSVNGNGWLKLGKTNYCGTAVSPALSNIEAGKTVDLDVSLVACPYTSGGNTTTNPGNHDVPNLMIGVYGDGEIVNPNGEITVGTISYVFNGNWSTMDADAYDNNMTTDEQTTLIQATPARDMAGVYKVKKFTLVNYPNSKLQDVWFYNDPLNCEEAKCEFQIKGATANTQIILFGGGYDNELYGKTQSKYTITGLSGKEYTGTYADNINRIFVDNIVAKVISE
jgi:hypothetical protein